MVRKLLYRLYHFVSSTEYWIRRRFTLGGLLVLAGLILCSTLGLDTNQAVAYQAFCFLACLLLAAIVFSWLYPGKFRIQRLLPRFGTVDTPLIYRLSISNLTDHRQQGLSLIENLADPRPSFAEFTQTPAEGGKKRNWFDRKMGYFHWRWLVAQKRHARIPEEPLPVLNSKTESEVLLETLPLRRGKLTFIGSTLARPDPFGLFRSFTQFPKTESVLILPRRYPIPNLSLPGTLKYQRGGVSLASSVGESEEFISLREYRPGDPLRRIHWPSWAHAGKPIVKEFQDEFFVRHALVLDTFLEKEPPVVFEEAVSVAASFACCIRTQESLLDLMFVGNEAYCFSAGRGVGHTEQMLEILAVVRPSEQRTFNSLSNLVLDRASDISGIICIFLRWDLDREAFVKKIQTLEIPSLIMVVLQNDQEPGPVPPPPARPQHRFHFLQTGKIEEGLAGL